MKPILLVLALSACASTPQVKGWTPAEEHAATVLLKKTCVTPDPQFEPTGDDIADQMLKTLLPDREEEYGGTGLLVSQDRVLTNSHVVTCAAPARLGSLYVDVGDGVMREASVELLLPARDIARVILAVQVTRHVARVSIGPRPQVGDRVCYSSAIPIQQVRCGDVQPNDSPGSGTIYVDTFVQHGNSGSSVYDRNGLLVGLVYATLTCENGFNCEGAVTPIDFALGWLIP